MKVWSKKTYKVKVPIDLDVQYYSENKRFLLIEKWSEKIVEKKRKRNTCRILSIINEASPDILPRLKSWGSSPHAQANASR